LAIGHEPSETERRHGHLATPLNRDWLSLSLVLEGPFDEAMGVSAMVCDHLGRQGHHGLAAGFLLPGRRWEA